MADQFDEFLKSGTAPQAPSEGPVSVPSGAGTDEFQSFLEGQGSAAQQNPFDQFLQSSTQKPAASYPELFTSGLARNWAQMKAIPPSLKAMLAEQQGNQQEAVSHATEAQGILKEAGDSQWDLSKIASPEDFSSWLVEKLGEQGVTMLATLMTGGTGGIGANLISQQLLKQGLLSGASAKALILAGSMIPTYGLSTAMEAANTSQEQFEVTQTPQWERSLGAGAAKGLLELWAPLSIARALTTPGLQLGKSLPGAIAKLAAKEGSTEYAQELIDIYARKLADPSYSFFGEGPDWYKGEGFLRALEAGATGAAVGAVYGAPFAGIERRQERGNALGTQKPGTSEAVPPLAAGIPQEAIANDKVDIIKSGRHWTAETKFGEVFAVIDRLPDGGQTLRVQSSSLNKGTDVGKGHGSALYKALFDEALKAGYTIQSDTIVSEEASRVYEGMRKHGYEVSGPAGQLQKDTSGGYFTNDYSRFKTGTVEPIYKITAGPVTQLREMVQSQRTTDKLPSEVIANDPRDDLLQVGPLLRTLPEGNLRESFLDMVEANTPRFVEITTPPLENLSKRDQAKIAAIAKTSTNGDIKQAYIRYAMTAQMQEKAGMMDPRTYDLLDDSIIAQIEAEHEANRQNPALGNQLFTDTELENRYATRKAQSEKPRLLRVDQGSLVPAGITAQVMDLAPLESGRVWFTKQVTPEQKVQMLADYGRIQQGVEKARVDTFKTGELAQQLEEGIKPYYDQLISQGLRVVPSRGAGFYYAGGAPIQGAEEANLASTGRTTQIGIYDAVKQEISTFSSSERDFERWELLSGIIVALDLNKVDLVNDFEMLSDGKLKAKKPLTLDKVVPGVLPRYATPQNILVVPLTSRLEGPGVHLYPMPNVPEHGWSPEEKKVVNAVKQLKPVLQNILNEIGLKDYSVAIEVTNAAPTGVNSSAWAYVGEGLIGISPTGLVERGFNIELEAQVLNAVMHELGHLITYKYFRELPVEIQERLFYAHGKALLSARMGQGTVRSEHLGIPGTAYSQTYYLQFTEWLAEQIRRWSTSDEGVGSSVEQAFKKGADQIEAYYRTWEKKFGVKSAADLAQPDYYFSAFMDYLRTFGSEKEQVKQLMKQQVLYYATNDVLDSPVVFEVGKQVIAAIKSLEEIFPPEVRIQLNRTLDPHIIPGEVLPASVDAAARWIHLPQKNAKLIELAMAALKPESAYEQSREYLAHEGFHAYEDLGLITPQEIELLMADIRGHEQEVVNEAYGKRPDVTAGRLKADLHRRVKEVLEPKGWTQEQIAIHANEMWERELRALYVQKFANTGLAFSEPVKGILARVLAVIERVREFLTGIKYRTREELVKAFFKGEMTYRDERNSKRVAAFGDVVHTLQAIDQGKRDQIHPDRTIEVEPGLWMSVEEYENGKLFMFFQGGSNTRGANPPIKNLGPLVGHAMLWDRGAKGWELDDLASDKPNSLLIAKMGRHVAKDLGISLQELGRPPAEASQQGMQYYQRMASGTPFEGVFDWYVKDPVLERWYSPNYIRERMNYAQFLVARERSGQPVNHLSVKDELTKWKILYTKVPKEAWNDPRLSQMFALDRNFKRDEVQGSIIRDAKSREEGKLLKAIGFPGDQRADPWKGAFEQKQVLSQAEAARNLGVPFEQAAPATALTYEIRQISKWYDQATRMGNRGSVDKELRNLAHETDRIGWFSRQFWTLNQLAWRNEDIVGLREYKQHMDAMGALASSWLSRADGTAKAWRKVPTPERKEAVADTLFKLSEMAYRLPVEQRNGIVRLPDGWADFLAGQIPVRNSELDRLFKAAKLTTKDYPIIRSVQNDFLAFLQDVQAVREKLLKRTHKTSPQMLQQALAELQKEMAELRNKPYFPMVRFGEFTITVRDPANNKVIWASAYTLQSQRDAAVAEVRKKFPNEPMTIGRIPASTVEFMSLPGPLLRAIKENILDESRAQNGGQLQLIREQKIAMEEFEQLHLPDRTFRKRWMPAHGIPGYSTDAFRAYAHYFQSGARYLSRLAFMDELRDDINKVNISVTQGNVGNTAKRSAIVSYMRNHYQYVMEGGKDSGKFRALASMWFLGFSVPAAFMNLTQTFVVTVPTLGAHFGSGKAYAALNKGVDALKLSAGYGTGTPGFMKAREEMISQGKIDVGQAPELGAFAEGSNLVALTANTKVDRVWQQLSLWGMKMFGMTEHYNRELTFKMAFDLAMENPNVKRMQEIDAGYPIERGSLMQKGLSYQEANATLFAKEMIEQTQFEYNKSSDAPFMRGQVRKNFLIFFKYTQGMLYALRYNGAALHMLLIMAFLYGLSGLPGADEWNEVFKLLAKKLFGKDYDLEQEARSFVRDLTKGTVFDKVGPDLALHGISRYGFGLGLLPDGYGIPRFDASANGSMGRIVPGLAETLHGFNTGAKWGDTWEAASNRMAGAGYGYFFSLMHYASDPLAVDSKKWEQLLPRQLKAIAQAYRYSSPEGEQPLGMSFLQPVLPTGGMQGAETTRSGAKIVKFDATDPDDISTVLFKAAGFTPTKVSETWDLLRASREALQVYSNRRQAIYVQFDKALTEGNPKAITDVQAAIQRYNEDVSKLDPGMAIKARELQSSLRERAKARSMQEQTLAANKREYQVIDRMRDLYPGVEQKVK